MGAGTHTVAAGGPILVVSVEHMIVLGAIRSGPNLATARVRTGQLAHRMDEVTVQILPLALNDSGNTVLPFGPNKTNDTQAV